MDNPEFVPYQGEDTEFISTVIGKRLDALEAWAAAQSQPANDLPHWRNPAPDAAPPMVATGHTFTSVARHTQPAAQSQAAAEPVGDVQPAREVPGADVSEILLREGCGRMMREAIMRAFERNGMDIVYREGPRNDRPAR